VQLGGSVVGLQVGGSSASASLQPAGYAPPVPLSLLSAQVEWASQAPPLNAPSLPGRSASSSAATKRGLRYEAKVTQALYEQWPRNFISQLPLSFRTNSKRGRAIPDGLLLSPDGSSICVIEIKTAHTVAAWWQLENFYAPIAREAFPGFRIVLLEICGSYDPDVKLPKRTALLDRVAEVFEADPGSHCVLVTRTGALPPCSTSGSKVPNG
jgi:hypothetical protein